MDKNSGELVKLKIQAFEDKDFSKEVPGEDGLFTAMFNPTTFNRKLEIEYNEVTGIGTSRAKMEFSKIAPQDYDLELLIDGTGASGVVKDVTDEIENFIKVCATFVGKLHRPNYLQIIWDELILKVVLASYDITYTMFDKTGKPLRAKIAASFKSTASDEFRTKDDKTSSPDLTHVRIVKEGDTLPLMTQRIYGSSDYYLEVARANNIRNFRSITPGQTIYFPPIEK